VAIGILFRTPDQAWFFT